MVDVTSSERYGISERKWEIPREVVLSRGFDVFFGGEWIDTPPSTVSSRIWARLYTAFRYFFITYYFHRFTVPDQVPDETNRWGWGSRLHDRISRATCEKDVRPFLSQCQSKSVVDLTKKTVLDDWKRMVATTKQAKLSAALYTFFHYSCIITTIFKLSSISKAFAFKMSKANNNEIFLVHWKSTFLYRVCCRNKLAGYRWNQQYTPLSEELNLSNRWRNRTRRSAFGFIPESFGRFFFVPSRVPVFS